MIALILPPSTTCVSDRATCASLGKEMACSVWWRAETRIDVRDMQMHHYDRYVHVWYGMVWYGTVWVCLSVVSGALPTPSNVKTTD